LEICLIDDENGFGFRRFIMKNISMKISRWLGLLILGLALSSCSESGKQTSPGVASVPASSVTAQQQVVPSTQGNVTSIPNQVVTGALVQVQPTPASQDVFGQLPQAVVGDVLAVRDPQGVVCGLFVIKMAGKYGFVHIYADDPATMNIDEGASAGDILSFELNGQLLRLTAGGNATWQADGIRARVDLTL